MRFFAAALAMGIIGIISTRWTSAGANQPQEGFSDADTLVVAGEGDSSPIAKTNAGKRAQAFEIARMRAKQQAGEMCRPQQAACGRIERNTDLEGRIHGVQVVHSHCSEIADGGLIVMRCRVAIEVKMKGIQALCGSAQKSQAL